MTIRILKSKITPLLHQFQFFKNSKHVGHCKTIIKGKGAILSDLEIYDPYKKQGFGSQFLQKTEALLKNDFDVEDEIEGTQSGGLTETQPPEEPDPEPEEEEEEGE